MNDGGTVSISSGAGVSFTALADAVGSGFETTAKVSTIDANTFVESGGSSYVSKVFTQQAAANRLGAGESQTFTISAADAGGAMHAKTVTLSGKQDLDAALKSINDNLQATNDSTLQKIVAVADGNSDGSAAGIRFISSLNNFQVSVGTGDGGHGFVEEGTTTQGKTYSSSTMAGGGTADISTETAAKNAVATLADAVTSLGAAQAVVGKGQNQFNYAVNLAQSQLSNLAAAESRIRDADLANEAANMSKAQILLQAGIAALAQANSAPQQVLSLLRG